MVSGMVRLCPTCAVLAALTIGTFGCSGQKLEGRWRGPLPLEDAKACVTNLYGNERFDVICEKGSWIGSGKYKATSDQIRLDFLLLTRSNQVVKHPAPLEMTYEGRGNELGMTWREMNFTWKRHL